MLVRDLLYNNDFDMCVNYEIWEGTHHDDGNLLASGFYDGHNSKPLDEILDMKIVYITTNVKNGTLIIEVER